MCITYWTTAVNEHQGKTQVALVEGNFGFGGHSRWLCVSVMDKLSHETSE